MSPDIGEAKMTRDPTCPCMQGMRDLLMAAKPDSDLLKKIECADCGKTVWVNLDTKYCFDCEGKHAQKQIK